MTTNVSDRHAAGVDLHSRPPITPAGLLLRWRPAVPLLVATFLALTALAAWEGGSLARTWDGPIQRWTEAQRTAWLDDAVRAVTRLGGLTVIVMGGIVLLAAVRRRCRALATVLVVAVLARPMLEWTLKAIVDRPRPNFDRLVDGTGPSFPSGHVMAAVALWGLVPPVVAVLTNRRFWWWSATVVSGLVVLLVAASRVYLGVHWLTDVVGGLILGSLYLLAAERLLEWRHRRTLCPNHPVPPAPVEPHGATKPFPDQHET